MKTIRFTRRGVHLTAGLTMFTYVVCHLINHAFAVVSIEAANGARVFFVSPWTNPTGTLVLTVAALTHIGLALWTTYARRSLRMPAWQWTQLALGLAIPALLVEHALATGGGILRVGLVPSYEYVLAVFWHFSPAKGWLQVVLLVVAWSHASISIHHWLKVKPWYPAWQVHLYGIALIIPVAATMGYIAGGYEVLDKLKNPLWLIQMLKDIRYPGPDFDRATETLRDIWLNGYAALVAGVFLARQLRIYIAARKRGIRVTYPSGRRILIPEGATLLETSRVGNIPHASVCGGRGRCSTCRVLITACDPGCLERPEAVEKRVLDKLGLPPNVRLACQVRPKGNISCEPLLPPDVSAKNGHRRHVCRPQGIYRTFREQTALRRGLHVEPVFPLHGYGHRGRRRAHRQVHRRRHHGVVRRNGARRTRRHPPGARRRQRDVASLATDERAVEERPRPAAASGNRNPLRSGHRRHLSLIHI